MYTHTVKRNTQNKKSARVGRGGKRGKTSGRGHKGQNARAGSSTRPQERDYIKRIPKRRGYGKNRARTINPNRTIPTVISVADVEQFAQSGVSVVSSKRLVKGGFIKKKGGQAPTLKIVANGDISSKVTVPKGVLLTDGARQKIEKAGGTIR